MGALVSQAQDKMSQVSTFSFYKSTNREPSRTTLRAASSLFSVGKILIFVNTDYHKLHLQSNQVKRTPEDYITQDEISRIRKRIRGRNM